MDSRSFATDVAELCNAKLSLCICLYIAFVVGARAVAVQEHTNLLELAGLLPGSIYSRCVLDKQSVTINSECLGP